jgi:hypothetical protein
MWVLTAEAMHGRHLARDKRVVCPQHQPYLCGPEFSKEVILSLDGIPITTSRVDDTVPDGIIPLLDSSSRRPSGWNVLSTKCIVSTHLN